MDNLPEIRAAHLVDHLVRLSGLRSRDDLLRGLTLALIESTSARRVEIHSLFLDENQRFWQMLTCAVAGEKVRMVSNTMQTDPSALTPIDSEPERLRCVDRAEIRVAILAAPQQGQLTRFPVMLSAETHPWGVVELQSEAPLGKSEVVAAQRLIALYGNIVDMLDYSECDALTGLWNRKPFDDLFYKSLSSTQTTEEPPTPVEHRAATPASGFWLAMVDIDHFKQVNDNYGHLIGDEVLILVARILKTSFRAYDRVYRFGGEEFVVVLRCNDHDAAVVAMERFRVAMANYAFPQAGHITASLGLTEIVAGDSPAAACERADRAVYYAKHHGRNQVCSEADLLRRGLLTTDLKVGEVELF
jgi:diguanylate cyclase (GGDEF)-like protein